MTDPFEQQHHEDEAPLAGLAGPLSRRKVLLGGGLAAVATLAAACGGEDGGTASTGQATTTTAAPEEGETESETESEEEAAGDPPERAEGDLGIAQVAASLEVLAVQTYASALDAATSGALGDVPPAVAAFMTTAMEHHEAHLGAWNDVLFAFDIEEVTAPPEDLKRQVDDRLADVEDVTGAAELALFLEETAAATYLSVIPELEDVAAIDLAASIQPIDMQHMAVLRFVLGEYPVPETFADTDMAYEV